MVMLDSKMIRLPGQKEAWATDRNTYVTKGGEGVIELSEEDFAFFCSRSNVRHLYVRADDGTIGHRIVSDGPFERITDITEMELALAASTHSEASQVVDKVENAPTEIDAPKVTNPVTEGSSNPVLCKEDKDGIDHRGWKTPAIVVHPDSRKAIPGETTDEWRLRTFGQYPLDSHEIVQSNGTVLVIYYDTAHGIPTGMDRPFRKISRHGPDKFSVVRSREELDSVRFSQDTPRIRSTYGIGDSRFTVDTGSDECM